MRHIFSRTGFVLFFCALLLFLTGFSNQEKKTITTVGDLATPGLKVAVALNTPEIISLEADFPQTQFVPYSDIFLAYAEVQSGRVDACVYARRTMQFAIDNGVSGVHLIDEDYMANEVAVGISPVCTIPDFTEKLNTFIKELKKDGTLDEMYARWVLRKEETMPDIPEVENPSFTIKVGTSGNVMPYTYYVGTQLAGYDIELAYRFAAYLGAKLELKVFDFTGLIAAAQSGNIDCIMSNLYVTKERGESIPFSDVLFNEPVTVMVKDESASSATKQSEASDRAFQEVHWQDYNGKKLGVLVGPLMEDAAAEHFPDSEYFIYNTYPDCIAALLSGKIDAYLGDEQGLKTLHAEQPEIDYIHDRIIQNDLSFAFRKDDEESAALCEELNAFLAKSWEDGTIQELDDIWFGIDEERKIVDMSDLTGENGTIKVVTTSTDMPFSYIKDGKNVGYDIDLVVRFCRDRGYALELGDVDFSGRIPAIMSGKYDFTTDMNVTPERQEQVLFSTPTCYGGIVLAVMASDLVVEEEENVETVEAPQKESFLSGIYASFEKTFLRESRWMLFAQGIGVTLLITLLSILFGTALGFGVFMLCRNGNPAANFITRFCLWLVQGMPMVVLLMILYYVIFGKVAISAVLVAVLGFSLTSGAATFGLLKMGVGAVDLGQYEAAYALGYSNRRTFFRIILPQALPHILPAYKGETVGLIKATAIVGYIAVQDLTKMGDIVRSRTYEAFFPLIAVSIIYFILEGLIGMMISRLTVGVNPKRRKGEDILKGVRRND